MTPRSQSRWLLGAGGLAALALAGCGTGTKPSASLKAKGERQLLALIATARTDAANHDASGVHAALSQFVVDIHSLKATGQLSQKTAHSLEQGALATEQQAASQLASGQTQTLQVASTASTATTATQPAPAPQGPAPPGHDDGPPPGQAHPGPAGPGDGKSHPKPHGHDNKHGGDGGGHD